MLRDLSTKVGKGLKVYATMPNVPFLGLGNFLVNGVEYVNKPGDLWNEIEHIRFAKVFIHTGWVFSDINQIDAFLRRFEERPRIYILVDNRLKYSVRQFFGAIYYRFYLRQLYDGVIVAGRSSERLMRFLGEPKSRIVSGHYGAPSDLYPRWLETGKKGNNFVFVGSLDRRKGADLLASAWRAYKENGGTWSLRVYGLGPLACLFSKLPDVTLYGFSQPSVISKALLESFAFILPGRDDNWGTVVAEAAASGCVLISTRAVGATEDLIAHGKNGFIVSLTSKSIFSAISSVAALSHDELQSMCMASVEFSRRFDSDRLTTALKGFLGPCFFSNCGHVASNGNNSP